MVGVSELFGKSKLTTFLDLLRVLNPSRNTRSVMALFPIPRLNNSRQSSAAYHTGFTAGESLIRIVRIRGLNGIPRQIDHDYLLESAVGRLSKEDARRSIFSYLEETLGMRILKSKRQITVELATDEDFSYLDLGTFNCVAVTESHSFNSDGIMFEFTQTRSHPATFCYNVISKR